jgi:uncharacterized protein (TIGR02453 family)
VTEFRGFPSATFDWFEGLERDNSRAYFNATREVYERDVRGALEAMFDELSLEFGGEFKLFRQQRDVRFSPDKSPYKTYQGAIAGPAAGIGYYVQLSGEGLTVGGGFHTHSPAQTDRFRSAVDDAKAGADLVTITNALLRAGYALEGAALKTRPKGFDAEHPRIELLRRKELMAIKRVGTPSWLGRPAALEHIRKAWLDVKPLNEWIAEQVGPAEERPRPGRR